MGDNGCDGFGKVTERGSMEGIGTVAAPGLDVEPQIHISFFIDPDQAGECARSAIVCSVHDITGAFIKDIFQFNAAFPEQVTDCNGTAGTGFFILTKSKVYSALKPAATGQ